MNKLITSTFGVSLAALLVLLAANGRGLAEAITGLWQVMLRFSDTAPMGLVSFLFSLALAVASQPFLRKWMPSLKCPLSREFLIETAALAIALIAQLLQVSDLKGWMLGLLAGFMAPYVFKGLAALSGLALRGLQKAGEP
ncbi:MAG: hypothetical protein DI562_07215 [Stenotrophomonas acidaminiphila]|nr:MAG: hypothetical protein DI562_07215 [Stenotrophomonas acidaminiphila]